MIIAPDRWLNQTFLSRSSGTTIYLINDYLEIASVFRSHGLTVRTIYLADSHSRHEVLVNITEGGVMGVIIGFAGPGGKASDMNTNRQRNKQSAQRERDNDTRRQSTLHACLSEIIMTIRACNGFVVMMASPNNNAWNYVFVRSILGTMDFTTVDVHTCRILGLADYCSSIRVATTISVDHSQVVSTHADGCVQKGRVERRKMYKQENMNSDHSEARLVRTSDVCYGDRLKALGKSLALNTLLPILRAICLERMPKLERYPMDGPAEPVTDEPTDRRIHTRLPLDHSPTLPTAQALKYMKKLKESGEKPQKRKMKV